MFCIGNVHLSLLLFFLSIHLLSPGLIETVEPSINTYLNSSFHSHIYEYEDNEYWYVSYKASKLVEEMEPPLFPLKFRFSKKHNSLVQTYLDACGALWVYGKFTYLEHYIEAEMSVFVDKFGSLASWLPISVEIPIVRVQHFQTRPQRLSSPADTFPPIISPFMTSFLGMEPYSYYSVQKDRELFRFVNDPSLSNVRIIQIVQSLSIMFPEGNQKSSDSQYLWMDVCSSNFRMVLSGIFTSSSSMPGTSQFAFLDFAQFRSKTDEFQYLNLQSGERGRNMQHTEYGYFVQTDRRILLYGNEVFVLLEFKTNVNSKVNVIPFCTTLQRGWIIFGDFEEKNSKCQYMCKIVFGNSNSNENKRLYEFQLKPYPSIAYPVIDVIIESQHDRETIIFASEKDRIWTSPNMDEENLQTLLELKNISSLDYCHDVYTDCLPGSLFVFDDKGIIFMVNGTDGTIIEKYVDHPKNLISFTSSQSLYAPYSISDPNTENRIDANQTLHVRPLNNYIPPHTIINCELQTTTGGGINISEFTHVASIVDDSSRTISCSFRADVDSPKNSLYLRFSQPLPRKRYSSSRYITYYRVIPIYDESNKCNEHPLDIEILIEQGSKLLSGYSLRNYFFLVVLCVFMFYLTVTILILLPCNCCLPFNLLSKSVTLLDNPPQRIEQGRIFNEEKTLFGGFVFFTIIIAFLIAAWYTIVDEFSPDKTKATYRYDSISNEYKRMKLNFRLDVVPRFGIHGELSPQCHERQLVWTNEHHYVEINAARSRDRNMIASYDITIIDPSVSKDAKYSVMFSRECLNQNITLKLYPMPTVLPQHYQMNTMNRWDIYHLMDATSGNVDINTFYAIFVPSKPYYWYIDRYHLDRHISHIHVKAQWNIVEMQESLDFGTYLRSMFIRQGVLPRIEMLYPDRCSIKSSAINSTSLMITFGLEDFTRNIKISTTSGFFSLIVKLVSTLGGMFALRNVMRKIATTVRDLLCKISDHPKFVVVALTFLILILSLGILWVIPMYASSEKVNLIIKAISFNYGQWTFLIVFLLTSLLLGYLNLIVLVPLQVGMHLVMICMMLWHFGFFNEFKNMKQCFESWNHLKKSLFHYPLKRFKMLWRRFYLFRYIILTTPLYFTITILVTVVLSVVGFTGPLLSWIVFVINVTMWNCLIPKHTLDYKEQDYSANEILNDDDDDDDNNADIVQNSIEHDNDGNNNNNTIAVVERDQKVIKESFNEEMNEISPESQYYKLENDTP